uniref:Uncharacterized protein n=1 Tax=Anguilla anguilla TaxID=7936 RepID=A0A0E9R275_ANGAN
MDCFQNELSKINVIFTNTCFYFTSLVLIWRKFRCRSRTNLNVYTAGYSYLKYPWPCGSG